MLNILSIGGSDPSSGAGIQGDVRSCVSLGAHCLTAVTGVTSQNTSRFGGVEPVSARTMARQLGMVFSDFDVDAVKVGMVYSRDVIRAVSGELEGRGLPTVLDPVVRSTTGGMLIRRRAAADLKRLLLPLSTVVTPNRFEAEFLTGSEIDSVGSAREAAEALCGMGAESAVITGLEVAEGRVTDYVLTGGRGLCLSRRKIRRTGHGGGCNYSVALCHSLACGMPVEAAARFSQRFAYESIRGSEKAGRGERVTMPAGGDRIRDELRGGIREFVGIRGVYREIPECQTNFVFSRPSPASAGDVMGVEGRIVRSGRRAVVAGDLKYGGSRHVASAVLAASGRFPSLRSAVNIRLREGTVSRMRESGMVVLSYDRAAEPAAVKGSEGGSVRWGVGHAVRGSRRAPDAVFHRGDFGKEPMMIVFGRNPADVAGKLRRALARPAGAPRGGTAPA